MKESGITTSVIAIIIVAVIIIAGISAYVVTRPEELPPGEEEEEEEEEEPKIEKIKIGIIEPLTGYDAVFGTEAVDAYKLAVKHINEEGGIISLGGAKLELVIEDDEDTTEGARLAAERMAEVHKVPIVAGAYISRHTLSMADVLRGKAILVADALSDYITSGEFKYVFRPAASSSKMGEAAVEAAIDIQKKMDPDHPIETAAVLNEDSVFGRYVRIGFERALYDAGISVVYIEEYRWDITDVGPLMTAIHAVEPDVVFICPYFSDALLWAKAIDERGPGAKFWFGAGECGFADASSIKEGGEAVEFLTNSYNLNPAKDTPWNIKFLSDFEEEYGYKPAGPAGCAYPGMWTIKEILEEVGRRYPDDPLNIDHLREIFLDIEITEGPAVETYSGDIMSFDELGNSEHPSPAVWQVIEGKSYVVWPFEWAERDPIYPRPDWGG